MDQPGAVGSLEILVRPVQLATQVIQAPEERQAHEDHKVLKAHKVQQADLLLSELTATLALPLVSLLLEEPWSTSIDSLYPAIQATPSGHLTTLPAVAEVAIGGLHSIAVGFTETARLLINRSVAGLFMECQHPYLCRLQPYDYAQ
jgi:hypothetical protein